MAKMLTMEHGKRQSTLAAATWSVRPSRCPSFSVSTRRPLNEWQRLAFEWCVANPSRMLVLTSTKPRLIYHIAKRGEYVEFGLPHHCHGGEKYWISRDGNTKVLINVD
jgi:hypothetical protein